MAKINEEELSSSYIKRIGDSLTTFVDAKKVLSEMSSSLGNLILQSTELNETFLQNRERIVEMQTAIADAIPGVQRLGGGIGKVTETISGIALASRRNVIANTESIEKIFAATKLLGTTSEALVENFSNVGITFNNIGENLENSIAYVQSIGGNAKQVMEDVLNSTSELNKYNFSNGVQGLTKMAAQASMLKFDMRQTFTLAEAALNPEKAVELASAFQRLGVMSGTLSDPFQLMNQSINDPEGLQDSLIKMTKQYTYFDEKTKSFRINPQGMLTLREIAREAGLSYDELAKAGLAASELDTRLSQISPKITFANEEDKQYLANIASMNDQGEYTVKIRNEKGDEVTKRLADVTQEEMDKLVEEQKKGGKSLEEIARNQLTAAENMENDINAIKGAIFTGLISAPTILGGAETAGKFISTAGGSLSSKEGMANVSAIRDVSEKGMQSLTSLFETVMDSDLSVGEKFKQTGLQIQNFLDHVVSTTAIAGDKVFENLSKDLKKEFKIDLKSMSEDNEKSNRLSEEQNKQQIDAINNLNKSEPIIPKPEVDENNFEKEYEYIPPKESIGDIGINNVEEPKESVTKTELYGEQRLKDYLGRSDKFFDDMTQSNTRGMSDIVNKFSGMAKKLENNQASPEEFDEWINQYRSEIEKYGDKFSSVIFNYSDKLKESIETTASSISDVEVEFTEPINKETSITDYGSEVSNLIDQKQKKEPISELNNIVNQLNESVKDNLDDYAEENIKKYQESFDSIIKQVESGEKTSESLIDYVNSNETELKSIGNEFYDNMNKFANEMNSEFKQDEKFQSDFMKIIGEYGEGKKSNLEVSKYIKENYENLKKFGYDVITTQKTNESEKVGVNYEPTEKKSSFIEGKNAIMPIEPGQVKQGGQSLTQTIQHKVEFGKITVEVKLPDNFSQLSTEQQQRILDDVFRHNDFQKLVSKVNSVIEDPTKQVSQTKTN